MNSVLFFVSSASGERLGQATLFHLVLALHLDLAVALDAVAHRGQLAHQRLIIGQRAVHLLKPLARATTAHRAGG